MNLLSVIEKIKSQIEQLEEKKRLEISNITKKYDKEIDEYKTALEVNKNLNTACRYCKGKGYTERPSDSTFDCRGVDKIKCNHCNGIGVKQL